MNTHGILPKVTPSKLDAHHAVEVLLRYIGEDPERDGIKGTAQRVVKWLEEFKRDQPGPDLTSFDGIVYDQMLIVKGVQFASLCEHHLLPFRGTAAVAYIPEEGGKVIGLSKLARIVVWCGRRLQVQERMTQEVLEAVEKATGSKSVAVRLEAEHLCMAIRGVERPDHATITTALSGAFKTNAETRHEFISQVL